MAEQDTSADEEKRILMKDEIQWRIASILTCRQLIAAVNEVVGRFPSLSEIASDVVKREQSSINRYSNEIRDIKNG